MQVGVGAEGRGQGTRVRVGDQGLGWRGGGGGRGEPGEAEAGKEAPPRGAAVALGGLLPAAGSAAAAPRGGRRPPFPPGPRCNAPPQPPPSQTASPAARRPSASPATDSLREAARVAAGAGRAPGLGLPARTPSYRKPHLSTGGRVEPLPLPRGTRESTIPQPCSKEPLHQALQFSLLAPFVCPLSD